MDKARELLERALTHLNPWHPSMGERRFDYTLREEIRAYLEERKDSATEALMWARNVFMENKDSENRKKMEVALAELGWKPVFPVEDSND